jgi:diacylglycerol kinase (ATP)
MASISEKVHQLVHSFGYALNGFMHLIKTEQNARIHLIITVCVMVAGFFFGLTATEWMLILVCISLVWATEALNTAIETLTDHLFKERHETAKIIKDVSAWAVLVCAIIAASCGLIIFLPKIAGLF